MKLTLNTMRFLQCWHRNWHNNLSNAQKAPHDLKYGLSTFQIKFQTVCYIRVPYSSIIRTVVPEVEQLCLIMPLFSMLLCFAKSKTMALLAILLVLLFRWCFKNIYISQSWDRIENTLGLSPTKINIGRQRVVCSFDQLIGRIFNVYISIYRYMLCVLIKSTIGTALVWCFKQTFWWNN